jgi:hypothetical protein
MDDLISRKALWDALKFREGVYGTHPYDGFHYSVTAEVVANAPSVPAVPMDKLCERLVNFSECPSCAECTLYGIKCGEYGECGSKEHWMAVLTKWMEGLDDHR